MSSSSRSFIVSLIAALLGVLTAVTVARAFRSDLATANNVRQQFEELDRPEQEELLRSAERFSKREEDERQRMKQLHAEVQNDPRLRQKLIQYNAWWEQLDSVERYRLKADGEFVDNWETAAEAVYQENQRKANEIVVRFRSREGIMTIKFTETQFEAFLDAAISPEPNELTKRLDQFPPDARAERALTKMVWQFARPFDSGKRSDQAGSQGQDVRRRLELAMKGVQDAVKEHLLPREQVEAMSIRQPALSAMYLIPRAVDAAIDHYEGILHRRQPSHNSEQYLTSFDALPRAEQVQVMQMERSSAQRQLHGQLVTDPAMAELQRDVERLKQIFRWSRWRGRGSGGGDRGPGGPAGRGGQGGRGPDGFERGPGGPGERGPRDRGHGGPPFGGRERPESDRP